MWFVPRPGSKPPLILTQWLSSRFHYSLPEPDQSRRLVANSPSPDPRRNKESYTSLNGITPNRRQYPNSQVLIFFQYFHQLVKIYLNDPIINKILGDKYWSKNLIDQERRKDQPTLSFHTSQLERAPWILLSPSLLFPVPLYSIIS